MDVRLFAAGLCCLLALASGTAHADVRCNLPPDAPAIGSRAALDAWLQRCPSPLRHMTPGARGRFLDALDFNERGITRLPTDDLSSELTRDEIGEVFSLLGLPAAGAPAGISPDEARRRRSDTSDRPLGTSDTELRLNALYYASMGMNGDHADTAMAALYDALFPATELAGQIAAAAPHDLRLMYRAALLASWHGYRDDHIDAATQALAALEAHGVATADELASMHQVLVRAGQFEPSRRFARRHADAGLRPLPPFHEPAPVATQAPSILRLSATGDALVHEAVDPASLRIVVVAGPGCRYSRAAAEAIAKDPDLGPRFQAQAMWLTSPSHLDNLAAVRRWNQTHPSAPLVIAASRERWPMLELDTVPRFHLFRDGELVASVTGWPVAEGNRDALLAALHSAYAAD